MIAWSPRGEGLYGVGDLRLYEVSVITAEQAIASWQLFDYDPETGYSATWDEILLW